MLESFAMKKTKSISEKKKTGKNHIEATPCIVINDMHSFNKLILFPEI